MKSTDFVRREVRALVPYEEEPAGGLNLAGNTNLFGTNPALEKALARVRATDLVDYPSLDSTPLRTALASKLGVLADQVVTGNGSNDLIDVLLRTMIEPDDPVAYHPPTFSMIPLFARMNHARLTPVPLVGKDWALDVEGLIAADAKVTFVVRPNNPTANAFPRREVERLVEELRGILVIDEAYVEFLGGESFLKEIREGHPRVIVLRTFSKAHGMAGLRAGYAVAPLPLAQEMRKVRGPFRLDALSETAAALALQDDRFLHDAVAGVRLERPNLQRALQARGFEVARSDANFLFCRPPYDAHLVALGLAKRGIQVREFAGDLAPYLRMTVGPPAATAKLMHALDEVIEVMKG